MIFLRHPTPEVEPGICYGRMDLEIAMIGHDQIAEALKSTPKATRIVASPARRCRKLAESLAGRDGLELRFDERLWEMHMGAWEGLAWKDIDQTHSEAWLKDPVNNATPNGESFALLQARVRAAISELNDDQAMTTLVVCHAGPIRATQMDWQCITFSEAFSQTPPYASPIRLKHPDWL